MIRILAVALLALSFLPLSGCKEEKPAPTPHAWAGKWTGPEGTALDITVVQGDEVTLAIQSLDKLDEYDGVIAGNVITFERDGTPETIRAGHGEETGMKWLISYTNCLIIKSGEGFCRE